MLIPKEKPYLAGLNSYYLNFEKLIEHLQGEIGSGCLHCRAVDQEILVYFDERDIIRGVTQSNGKRALISQDLDTVLQVLRMSNFLITVYYLDSASVFYWGEIPPFQRNKNKVNSTNITLVNLLRRLLKMKFSGFVDIDIDNHKDSALLFFHQGNRCGGSCSWGKGGLRFSEADYAHLLASMEEADAATFSIGRFVTDEVGVQEEEQEDSADVPGEKQSLSELNVAIREFLNLYTHTLGKKFKTDPILLLKQKFLDTIDEYPLLDPFANYYQLGSNGEIVFAFNVNRKEITKGIVNCTWKVVSDSQLEKKFGAAVSNWGNNVVLEKRGIMVTFQDRP